LRIDGLNLRLWQPIDLKKENYYLNTGISEIRPFDGREWPSIKIKLDPGGPSPLANNQLNREVQLLAYSDPFEAASSQHSRPASGRDFCSMMFPFGKTVTEPTSDAIQARRAMAHYGSSIVVLSTRWSVLRSCAYVHAIALRLALLQLGYFSVRGALFLAAIAVNIWYPFAIVLCVACLLCM
jgi:hypothetical protein